jgi:hypothetical protein
MTASAAAAAGCLAVAVALWVPVLETPVHARRPPSVDDGRGWMRRHRLAWATLAGAAALSFVSGPGRWPAAALAAAVTWVVIGRTESPGARRAREAARRDLPHLVGLLGDALRAGQSPDAALALVGTALPGPAGDRLGAVVGRLRLGMDPVTVWAGLADDEALAPLGRALVRGQTTGASVLLTVERLAETLSADLRGEIEDQARAVGVKAALPLGLCLLPAFVLLGIVPTVAGMLHTLGV